MTRDDFPILKRTVHGKPWIYLDNAATTQKPQAVIDAVSEFYRMHNSNVHRGAHTVSAEATVMYEDARETAREFLNAARTEEIIFTKGTTDAINIVAAAWGSKNLKQGDVVLITEMEHHANIVPWHMICERTGAILQWVPVLDDGSLDLESAAAMLTPQVKMFAFTHASNTTGAINPVRDLCAMARRQGITTLVDGAQAVAHLPVDVQDLGCDFYAFSGHKVYGPTGIGVLYGKYDVLVEMPPYQGGGAMIHTVSKSSITYLDPPQRFETGTPHIAGAVGLRVSLRVSRRVSLRDAPLENLHEDLHEVPGLRLIGRPANHLPIYSFVVRGVHSNDIGMLLDEQGIAVRVGHHCTQPLMQRFGVSSTVRASFAFYNTKEEADALIDGIRKAVKMLS